MIRAFSKYFALVNVAEEAYQHIKRTDRLKSGFDSWEGSFDQTLRECKASEMDDTQLESLINSSTSIENFSHNIDSSFANAMFTSRKEFSDNLTISAVEASVVETSPLQNVS